MVQRMVIIGLLILCGSTAALALQCHVCTNGNNAECWNINGPKDDRFLVECSRNSTLCTIEIKRGKYDKIFRKCASKNWSSKSESSTCSEDGCNYGNDVEENTSSPTISITPMEIIMANMYGIGAIALVTTLLVVFCIAKACFRHKGDDEEEEEEEEVEGEEGEDGDVSYEEEEEEEYVDEDSIEQEYDEYDKEAEEAYNKHKGKGHKEETV